MKLLRRNKVPAPFDPCGLLKFMEEGKGTRLPFRLDLFFREFWDYVSECVDSEYPRMSEGRLDFIVSVFPEGLAAVLSALYVFCRRDKGDVFPPEFGQKNTVSMRFHLPKREENAAGKTVNPMFFPWIQALGKISGFSVKIKDETGIVRVTVTVPRLQKEIGPLSSLFAFLPSFWNKAFSTVDECLK